MELENKTFTNKNGVILQIGTKDNKGEFTFTEMGSKGKATAEELKKIIEEGNYTEKEEE